MILFVKKPRKVQKVLSLRLSPDGVKLVKKRVGVSMKGICVESYRLLSLLRNESEAGFIRKMFSLKRI